MAAHLILVQIIVVRVHAGKQDLTKRLDVVLEHGFFNKVTGTAG